MSNQSTLVTDLDTLSAPDLDFAEFERLREGGAPEEPESKGPPAPETPAAETAEESDTSETNEEQEGKDGEEPEEPKEEEGKETKKEEPKRPTGYQRKAAKVERLARENAELTARVAELEKGGAAGKPAGAEPAKPAEAAKAKPKVEDFENYEDYTEALTDWKTDQKLAAFKKEQDDNQSKAAQERQRQAAVDAYNAREAKFKEDHDDYDEVMDSVEDLKVPEYMRASLLESERGVEIGYYLATHRQEAEAIAAMSPLACVRALGKLEASLEADSKANTPPARKKVTQAPNPVTAVSGGSGKPVRSMDDPNLPYAEWERKREADLRQRGRR